ncbi:MAG TPA: SDR family NAD(P)-dependent oxidoreductase [Stellaceae bacterium]|nr:SDR family NAD(P)-dependent oxidoreductase [Stellaceae bacterium]
MRFTGKAALIAGGANGIGEATGLIIAREGARVALVDTDGARLDRIVAALRAESRDALAIEADVLSEAAVAAMVRQVQDRFQRIDILVNAVGGSTTLANPNTPLDRITLQEWERTIAFNLTGTLLCTQAVIPQMKRQGYGRIVNLSSIVGRGDTRISNAAYATAKAGIRAFTRKLAIELGPFGITCNATAPSTTMTERIQQLMAQRSPAELETALRDIPLGRMATAEDQAKVIAFLASDDAAFVSGQTIEVTGGQ